MMAPLSLLCSLALLSGIVTPASATFNLFLSTQEMKRLLGLENELFYVTEGRVNKYAMGFVIPVPSTVSALHFTWHSGPASSPSYHIATSTSHPTALPTPLLNISSEGTVPTEPQVWRLSLQCSGTEAAEVVITLDILLTGLDPALPRNTTKLQFRRKKTCFLNDPEEGEEEEVLEAAYDDGVPTYIVFFAGVGGCLLLLTVILSLVIGTWLRSTKSGKPVGDSTNCTQYSSVPVEPVQNNSGVQEQTETRGYSTSTLLPAPQRNSGGLTDNEWEGAGGSLVVDRLALTLGDLLLEGTFGRVYQGRLVRGDSTSDVMVKTIVTGSSRQQAEKLVTEGSLLASVKHKQLLSLVATTTDGSSPIMIYDFLSPGNLKKWLSGCHQAVSTHQAVSLGLQLLSGLRHLHRQQIIHRDVAARNCYLSSPSGGEPSVRLCDAALSKDLFPGDYHCLGDNDNRPVKWLSLDTLQSGQFSPSTDVWGWGVAMWEILTRAQQPFPDVDPFEMEGYLVDGFRLHQPVNCPDQLYTVMVSCWAARPQHRAAVPALYSHLKQFNTQLQQFV